MRGWWLGCVALALTACATTGPAQLAGLTTPMDAVEAAKMHPKQGAEGHFLLTVNEVGVTRRRSFLDSSTSYRNPHNLVIAMSHPMAKAVSRRLGVPFAELEHRQVVVAGVAKRKRITMVQDGRRTGRFYFQTWVNVTDPAQIKLTNTRPSFKSAFGSRQF